jgi:5-formyltetrahydrofolate cyclo-ligase
VESNSFDDIVRAKKSLRRECRKNLKAMNQHDREALSFKIAKRLFDLLKQLNCSSLGVYSPMSDEVIWHQGLGPEQLNQKRWLYPASCDTGMAFYHAHESELVRRRGDFGVDIPVPPQGLNAEVPEALIIPALAFDQQGFRLGRGGGFYDRYLDKYQGLTIGVCFDDLLLSENLPNEKHDQKVSTIVTEVRILRLTP